jgi:hypothetical protein
MSEAILASSFSNRSLRHLALLPCFTDDGQAFASGFV